MSSKLSAHIDQAKQEDTRLSVEQSKYQFCVSVILGVTCKYYFALFSQTRQGFNGLCSERFVLRHVCFD